MIFFKEKWRFLHILKIKILLESGSVDPHFFADPDPESQNNADPADPDPKHWFPLSIFSHLY